MSKHGLSAPERTTTTDQARDAILRAILDGRIPSGSPLRLQQLADDLGMSMMPIREAIRHLEATGIIEVERHRGARVRPLSDEDLADTYFTRIVLEGTLVRQAAHSLDATAAKEASDALDAQQLALRLGDRDAARIAHERFHFTIYRAADLSWLMRSIGPTWQNSERYRAHSLSDEAEVAIRRREHESILAACTARDSDAAVHALQEHLLATVEGVNPKIAAQIRQKLAEHNY
ncbi:GntR family transcriptional regulator [Rhodococcus sp. 05-2256-B2]|uniref:GntR family transcriptional regulator n=1 Tax=Nocardiaceae TaxID=85025 RepID=UPI00050C35F5|nr:MULTISPECIES: GntR family transcriptional regulator [Rhodococcus]MBY4383764.1 GntR family transcriptional regulator [Rhodococcus fascians]MBY4398975.1 GntR family transcriptional regulator [Rhodococcus fascians]MBY4408513.1 GntR family transcriptional regulator [Rhodococcus fascians]MBY4423552.1 GntR family transcriptional regulator [Rhodococcus fascians]MBY4462924.1 GntR family transcriptional regulator [Rhodococcus fascians]